MKTMPISMAVLSLLTFMNGALVAETGAKIYAAKCASCHGKDGKGNPAMAKVFKVDAEKLSLVSDAYAAKADADLVKVTTDGLNKMPAYKGKLTEAEIQDVVAYTRTFVAAQK